MVGLAIHLVGCLLFNLLLVSLGVLSSRKRPTHPIWTSSFKRFLIAAFVSALLIMARSSFRLAEMIVGWIGYISVKEWWVLSSWGSSRFQTCCLVKTTDERSTRSHFFSIQAILCVWCHSGLPCSRYTSLLQSKWQPSKQLWHHGEEERVFGGVESSMRDLERIEDFSDDFSKLKHPEMLCRLTDFEKGSSPFSFSFLCSWSDEDHGEHSTAQILHRWWSLFLESIFRTINKSPSCI